MGCKVCPIEGKEKLLIRAKLEFLLKHALGGKSVLNYAKGKFYMSKKYAHVKNAILFAQIPHHSIFLPLVNQALVSIHQKITCVI
jgi:hypothetical protein